jgi:cytochrome d ubiquinol oxidase subunit I
MTSIDVVSLSRMQFGLTALYHFLFVPLTLCLSLLLGIMESVYVMTGRAIWRDMTKFWGLLFGINFAMGVATGITMEFQFGMNWAYYSHYVGDIFGAPLAIEGLMAFFLEATFIGLFFFGWDKLSSLQHLCVTWLVALGSNLSALWILIANGWMQNPVGAKFNPDTMRMEVTNFTDVVFNPVAQAKFVHTVSAGYVTGAMFVLSVSAFYLIKGRHIEIAKRSMTVAASFGLAAALSVVVLGDESGYTAGENQKMKIAAIEAMWDTEPAPASFTIFGLPDLANRRTDYEVKVPWMLGLIATRSIDKTLPGIKELVAQAEVRIRNGLIAYDALEKLRAQPTNTAERARLDSTGTDLGYALLLKKIRPDIVNATADQIGQAAWSTVPAVSPLFWSFRIMVGLGFYRSVRRRLRARQPTRTDPISRVPVGSAAQPAAAVGCSRTRMDRRRSRPATLGHRGRAAHFPCGLQHLGSQCLGHVDWLHRVLLDAGRRRSLSDGPDGQGGAVRELAGRASPKPARRRSRIAGEYHVRL